MNEVDRRGVLMGWRFWLWWVLACTAGWAIGAPIGVAAGSSGNIVVAGSVGVAVGGVVAGVLQWLVLRRQITRAGRWVVAIPGGAVVAAVAGVAVGLVAGAVSDPGTPSPLGGADVRVDAAWIVGAGTLGTTLGVLQWLLVLRRRVTRAGWWVLASTVGWITGGPVARMVGAIAGVTTSGVASWAVLGGVYGAMTGPVLLWLLRWPVHATTPVGNCGAGDLTRRDGPLGPHRGRIQRGRVE